MSNNIIASIRYAIDEYECYHHEHPDKILLNYKAISSLATELECRPEVKATIYDIPVAPDFSYDDTPRFWLCKEGKIYD